MNLIICWEIGGAASWAIARKLNSYKRDKTVPFYPNPWHSIINRAKEDSGIDTDDYIDFLKFYGEEEATKKVNSLSGIQNIENEIHSLTNHLTAEKKSQFFKSVNVDGYMLQDLTGRSYLGKIDSIEFLKYVYLISNYIEDVLDNQNPKRVFDLGTNSFIRMLISLHCKQRQIEYRSIVHSCFGDIVFVTDYLNLSPSKSIKFTKKELLVAKNSISNYLSSKTALRSAERRDEKRVNTFNFGRAVKNSLISLFFAIRISVRKNKKFLKRLRISNTLRSCIDPNPWSSFISHLICNFRELVRSTRKRKVLNLDDRKFFYVPLSYDTEALDYLFCGDSLGDQMQVNMLRPYLPLGNNLLVKDHRAMVGERRFLDERIINSVPNCCFVSNGGFERSNLDPINLIKKSNGVIIVQGTSGLEAAMIGKPLLILGSPVYKEFIFPRSILEKMNAKEFFKWPSVYICKKATVEKYIALCLNIGAEVEIDYVLEASALELTNKTSEINKLSMLLYNGKGL